MKFEYEGTEYRIRFMRMMEFTTCYIDAYGPDGQKDLTMAEGETKCSKKDQFCREIGRRWALRRALQKGWPRKHSSGIKLYSSETNLAFRRKAWAAYLGRKKRLGAELFPERAQLKPCPWCGETDGLMVGWSGSKERRRHRVFCDDCGIRGPEALKSAGAIRQWNDQKPPKLNTAEHNEGGPDVSVPNL